MERLIRLALVGVFILALVPGTAINAQIDINNNPNNFDFGILDSESNSSTGLSYFIVTNNSTTPVNISISGTDLIGGANWALSDTATPGSDTYGLLAGLDGGSYDIIVKKNGPYNSLVSNLGVSANQSWGLQLLAPTSFSDSVVKSGNVTLTATMP